MNIERRDTTNLGLLRREKMGQQARHQNSDTQPIKRSTQKKSNRKSPEVAFA